MGDSQSNILSEKSQAHKCTQADEWITNWYMHTINYHWVIKGKDILTHVCAQLCRTLCNLMDCSPPGSSVHEFFQTRELEWVVVSCFRGSSWHRDWTLVLSLESPSLVGGCFTTAPPGEPRGHYDKSDKPITWQIYDSTYRKYLDSIYMWLLNL